MLLVALSVLEACEKNAPDILTETSQSANEANARAAFDSAKSADMTTATVAAPSNVTTISLKAGDKITVEITSNECSGNPETVNVYGLFTGTIFSGTCAGGLVGQKTTLGPAGADGVVWFTAAHPFFGEGAPGPITGPAPDYAAYLDDGATCCDYNDVILAIHVIQEPGELTCTPAPLRGQEVKCTVTGIGVAVTSWTFTGPAYHNATQILRVIGPTSGNVWKGPAVTSGDVTANVTVNGSPRSKPLTSSFAVRARTGDAWSWGPNNHWRFTRGTPGSGPACGFGQMLYAETTREGWNRRKGTCDELILTPAPGESETGGYTVKQAPAGGPNAGLWYVSALSYQMLEESNINIAITPNSPYLFTLFDATEKAECAAGAGKAISKATFYFFNETCKKVDVAGYVKGTWNHEGYGLANGTGHQAQLEMAARRPEYELYAVEEQVFAPTQTDARTLVRSTALSIATHLDELAADHSNIYGKNWVGTLWKWIVTPPHFSDVSYSI